MKVKHGFVKLALLSPSVYTRTGPLSKLDLVQEKEENPSAKRFENKPTEKQLNSVGQRLPGMCEAVSLIPQHCKKMKMKIRAG